MQCSRTFDLLIPGEVQVGQQISATVTNPSGNTSEFPDCREVTSSAGIFADDFE
jgi:hypothetical protein